MARVGACGTAAGGSRRRAAPNALAALLADDDLDHVLVPRQLELGLQLVFYLVWRPRGATATRRMGAKRGKGARAVGVGVPAISRVHCGVSSGLYLRQRMGTSGLD